MGGHGCGGGVAEGARSCARPHLPSASGSSRQQAQEAQARREALHRGTSPQRLSRQAPPHLVRPNVQAAVDLHAVGADDFAVQGLGQCQRGARLAHRRGPRQHQHLGPLVARGGCGGSAAVAGSAGGGAVGGGSGHGCPAPARGCQRTEGGQPVDGQGAEQSQRGPRDRHKLGGWGGRGPALLLRVPVRMHCRKYTRNWTCGGCPSPLPVAQSSTPWPHRRWHVQRSQGSQRHSARPILQLWQQHGLAQPPKLEPGAAPTTSLPADPLAAAHRACMSCSCAGTGVRVATVWGRPFLNFSRGCPQSAPLPPSAHRHSDGRQAKRRSPPRPPRLPAEPPLLHPTAAAAAPPLHTPLLQAIFCRRSRQL